MGKTHAKNSRIVYGPLALSGHVRRVTTTDTVQQAASTTLVDAGDMTTPGRISGAVSVEGLFDDTVSAGGQDETLDTALGAAAVSPVTVGPNGFALGERVVTMDVREASYALGSKNDDVVSFAAEFRSEDLVDRGVSLHDLTAESATANGTTVDQASASSAGAGATLHVTANSRDGNTTVVVQHSTNGSTWADLITFAAVGAALTAAEKLAAAGTVNRYVRAIWTLAGTTGTATFTVAFARR